MFDPRPLYCSSLTTTVGGTKDTNFVDSDHPTVARISNTPSTFQRYMISFFSDLVEEIKEIFLDDFFVFRLSFRDYLKNLATVI